MSAEMYGNPPSGPMTCVASWRRRPQDAATGYLQKHGIEEKLADCLRTMLRRERNDERVAVVTPGCGDTRYKAQMVAVGSGGLWVLDERWYCTEWYMMI